MHQPVLAFGHLGAPLWLVTTIVPAMLLGAVALVVLAFWLTRKF